VYEQLHLGYNDAHCFWVRLIVMGYKVNANRFIVVTRTLQKTLLCRTC